MTDPNPSQAIRDVLVHTAQGNTADVLVSEQPLQLSVNGRRYTVMLRTPNTSPSSDLDLCTGFLRAEGLIEDWSDVRSLGPCTDQNNGHRAHTVVAHLESGCGIGVERFRSRSTHVTAACGACGLKDIRQLMPSMPERVTSPKPEMSLVQRLPQDLRSRQVIFARTGGIHGAALFDSNGRFIWMDEDVGRHNALDKVIGNRIRTNPSQLMGAITVVSGRIGFELVQKALMAGIGSLVGVGAASSLAHDLAYEYGLHLFSFTKPTSVNYHGVDSKIF